jgi:hypothetical protein
VDGRAISLDCLHDRGGDFVARGVRKADVQDGPAQELVETSKFNVRKIHTSCYAQSWQLPCRQPPKRPSS